MKNSIKAIALTLAAVCLASMTACGDGNGNAKKENIVTSNGEKTYVLADYETFDDMYDTYDATTWMTFEGSYNRTTNSDEVISGNGSLKLHIEKFITSNWNAYEEDTGLMAGFSYNVFSTVKNGGNWGFDFKNLSKIAIDVYNPNDFDVRLSMFTLSNLDYPRNYGTATVAAGQTRTVYANVNRYFMQNEVTDRVSYIMFTVNYDKVLKENGELYYPVADLYFDNITATVDNAKLTSEDGETFIDKKLSSSTEILNFEDAGDIRYVLETGGNYVKELDNQWVTKSNHVGTGSAYYYNTDSAFTKGDRQGSLEWRVTPVLQKKYTGIAYGYNVKQNYTYNDLLTGITVVSDYLNYYNFADLQDGKKKICVDVYNAAPYDKEVFFGIHDKTGVAMEVKKESPYLYGADGMCDKLYRLPAGEWTTLELTDFSHLDLSAGLARLRLMTSLMDVYEEISLYVNDLRIEYLDGTESEDYGFTYTAPTSADQTAPKIWTSYGYKIVKVGEAFTLPTASFSEKVTATYQIGETPVQAGATYTPTETGVVTLKITATDAAGNVSVKNVKITVTDNDFNLNKLYALDTAEGLVAHAGTTGVGLNELRLKLITDAANNPVKDAYGKTIPALFDSENGNSPINSFITIENKTTCGRMMLNNALYLNPQDTFEKLYFYFYYDTVGYSTGTDNTIELNFNGYVVKLQPKAGWQKVEISPKEVTVDGVTKMVTDYSAISALGHTTTFNEVIDLNDMIGSFLTITTKSAYEKMAMSAIYGVRKA